MQELQVFRFEDSAVRTVIRDGQPWFVAVDVCRALDIGNPSLVVNGRERSRENGTTYWSGGLDEDEKGLVTVNTPGGDQDVLCVTEAGVYNLVFQSRKPEARMFKRWITHEVIPSIRQTGQYTAPQAEVIPLSKDQALVTLLRTTADLVEDTTEIKQVVAAQSERIDQVERRVDEQITLDSGEQRRLQKAVAKRVYELESEPLKRPQMYAGIYREIKDRWAVPSYKDVRRTELPEVLQYVQAWKPRIA